LPGEFTNSGTIYAVTSNASLPAANIAANNIYNQSGGLLTTVLPTGGIAGLSNLYGSFSLNLTAIHDIINYGTISSAGALSAIAGGTITNGLAGAAAPAIMQAVNNLNLQASQIINNGMIASQMANINATCANLVNAGTIQASMGNIAIQSLTNSLIVNNNAGSILAQQNLTFKTLDKLLTADGTPGANINFAGGALAATNVNFTSEHGWIGIDADSIGGSVNIKGAGAGINVGSGGLHVASFDVTGDPIMSVVGDLDLTGVSFNPIGAEDFIALATGNIFGGAVTINTNGGQIFLSAGYNFTVGNPACTSCAGQFTTDTNAITLPGAVISLSGSSLNTTGAS